MIRDSPGQRSGIHKARVLDMELLSRRVADA